MPLPALQMLERKLEKQKRLFELRKGALEQQIGRHIQRLEQKKGLLERKIEQQLENHKKRFESRLQAQRKRLESRFRRFEQTKGIRLDDEVRFIRSWIEKPLAIGAVTPSGRALARTMAGYVDPRRPGPVIELGPGTGPVTEALLAQGIDQSRLVLVEFDPTFCRLLRKRYPAATVVQGDALDHEPRGDGPLYVIGNLPYAVTSPLLFHLLDLAGRIEIPEIVVMVQREVADRLAASPGTKAYGALTVGVALSARVELLFEVGRGQFRPPPKVRSTVCRLVPGGPPGLGPGRGLTFPAGSRATPSRRIRRPARRAPPGSPRCRSTPRPPRGSRSGTR